MREGYLDLLSAFSSIVSPCLPDNLFQVLEIYLTNKKGWNVLIKLFPVYYLFSSDDYVFSEISLIKSNVWTQPVNLSRLTHDVLISLKCYPVYVPKYTTLMYDSLPIGSSK